MFLPLAVDDREESDKSSQVMNGPESSEMNTAEKLEKLQLMPCALVPTPSVSSWTPVGPTRNSSGSKFDLDLLLHSHIDTCASSTIRDL